MEIIDWIEVIEGMKGWILLVGRYWINGSYWM